MINQILILLFSLTGFLFGLILSFIAPEELKPGKKYFILIKEILFYLIIFFSFFIFIYFKNYYFILIPLIYLILNLILVKKKKYLLEEILNYSFFILYLILLIIISLKSNLSLILPSLIFFYGLPSGTLARLRLIEKQEAKYSDGTK